MKKTLQEFIAEAEAADHDELTKERLEAQAQLDRNVVYLVVIFLIIALSIVVTFAPQIDNF